MHTDAPGGQWQRRGRAAPTGSPGIAEGPSGQQGASKVSSMDWTCNLQHAESSLCCCGPCTLF